MSIKQLETSPVLLPPSSPSYSLTGKKSPASSFSDAINTAALKLNPQSVQSPALAATTAAELLKLEMMRSAISLGAEAKTETFSPLNIPVKLALNSLVAARQEIDTPENNLAIQNQPVSSGHKSDRPEESVQDIVNRASQKYRVDSALINAVIKAESNFNHTAVSSAGAQGLMQLMPATARGLGVKDSFNPEQNIMAGTRFLKDMINRYNGDLDSALAAYNWGPGNVDRKGTNSLPNETREYLVKVKSYYSQFIG